MKDVYRTYHMSDAELCVFTGNLVQRMTRDTAEFSTRGVSAADITDMETLGNNFEVFPPDEYYLSELMIAVDQKDTLHETLIVEIQKISGFFEQQWGLDSPEYKGLRIGDLQRQADEKFLFTCRNVHTRATDEFATLSLIGLAQADLDTLTADAQSFEDLLYEISAKKDVRDDKRQERVKKGNELYSYVSKYCKIGQLIWENNDLEKYEDYIIYKTEKHPPSKVIGMAYDLATGQCTWSGLSDADDYELQYAPDMPSPIFAQVYFGPNLGFIYNPGGPDNYLFRCRAFNADGSGEWSDVLVVVR